MKYSIFNCYPSDYTYFVSETDIYYKDDINEFEKSDFKNLDEFNEWEESFVELFIYEP